MAHRIVLTYAFAGEPEQVSFVNSICTTRGGQHVNYISGMVVNDIMQAVQKKNKSVSLKPNIVKQYMFVFVNCLIENPAFDSQTKETLTTTKGKFGSKCDLPPAFMKKGKKGLLVEAGGSCSTG